MQDHSKMKPRQQKVLRESRETDVLFNSMGDGAITTDEFGRITRINKPALKMLGYSRTELIGQPFLKFVIAETLEGRPVGVIDRPITQAFLTGKPVLGKMNYRTKKGTLLPVDINVSPLMFDNKPIGAIEVFRDISVELEIDRMKSEFISLASHQLRTPLSAIKTYTHMLSDGYMGELNDLQKSSLETIINASNRMNELISTLLNITRIESGTISVNLKPLNIEELIKEILPELNIMADGKAIHFKVHIAKTGSTDIKTDSLIVKEVITNLISNAIKYTPDNGQVSLNVKPRTNDILIEVKDTGWGIPEAARDKVFTKFFRGSNIIKKETSGTGLGLYLVKGLLDALGGKIWFKSTEKQGTIFYISLPRGENAK
ncbi:MAG TPA: ATP-binding protein [Candidatus Saccharimonadales bacterium]|nr:ATP-binding protein [Candidatus Saccharimonadales bacterium]